MSAAPERPPLRDLAVLGLCAGAAVVWVVVLAWHRPVPSEDGVSYLWMAQQFAAGDWAGATATVFPPGFPMLVALAVGFGLEVECAANVVNAAAFGLTIAPLASIAQRLSPRPNDHAAGWLAGLLFLSGSLLARVAAEVYSEPAFLLLMALGTAAGLRGGRWCHALGILSGVAFWFRPEGVLLALSFALSRPRSMWPALVWTAVFVLSLGWLRQALGHGFDPLPILAFHELRDDLPERGAVFRNVVEVPGAFLEAFGPVAVLLVLFAWPRFRVGITRDATRPLLWQIALQTGAILTFVVRRRFFLSAAVPVIALAGAALARLPRTWRALVVVGCLLFGVIGAWTGRIEPDRIAEREVGEYLGGRLQPGERVTGDLPRVVWFAGVRPPPPRHFDTEQLFAMAVAEDVRYFVFSERSQRSSSQAIKAELSGLFGRFPLPQELAARARERGIVVLARR